jgi:hypothetical protein
MKIWFVLVIFLSCSAVYGESPLVDPRIPHGESLRYRIIKGDDISYSTQEIFQESDGSERMYSVFTKSETQDSNLLLNRFGLIPFKSSVVHRLNGAEYSEETVIQKLPEFSSEYIAIIGFEDLIHVLRGFPFEKSKELKIMIIGQNQDDEMFSMDIRYQKLETIKIDGVSYKTHKLELVPQMPGFLKIINGRFPKTYFWYSVEKPHLLIRYEGSAGFGGDKQTTELVDSTW